MAHSLRRLFLWFKVYLWPPKTDRNHNKEPKKGRFLPALGFRALRRRSLPWGGGGAKTRFYGMGVLLGLISP